MQAAYSRACRALIALWIEHSADLDMGKKRKHLSHEEIWDDSALLNSWDAALQEYQFYHSIHARGERIEDVLRQAEDSEETSMEKTPQTGEMESEKMNGMPHSEELEDGEVEDAQIEDSSLPDKGPEGDMVDTKVFYYHQQTVLRLTDSGRGSHGR
ncbi:MAG: hypothetical protein Q9166_006994 [cf. Caloplaca sp. 2 TL-2023]